jgi:hypothetical protein
LVLLIGAGYHGRVEKIQTANEAIRVRTALVCAKEVVAGRIHHHGTNDYKGDISMKLVFLALLAWSGTAVAQEWVQVTAGNLPATHLGLMLQLTDGTILVQENKTPNWYILTPDEHGHYNTGTWSKKPVSMPAGYAPVYFAAAVMQNGKVVVAGGEYNYATKPVSKETNLAAIYDPVAQKWSPLDAPVWPATSTTPAEKWTQIGDAPSVVLPFGDYMIGSIQKKGAAMLNPYTLSWNVITFPDKFDCNGEEGYTLLPNESVLAIDTYCGSLATKYPTGTHSETYDPFTESWSSAGSTVAQLWGSGCSSPTNPKKPNHEMGPAVLLPGGTVFATGANECGPGNTALYDSGTQSWSAGPPIPSGITGTANDVADGPAALLPDGNVLVDTSPGYGTNPSTFYEFNPTTLGWSLAPQPAFALSGSSEGGRMLVTAEGNIMFVQTDTDNLYVYSKDWSYPDAWRPTICGGCYPTTVVKGETYTVSGTQFNGLSQGAAYGDDAQSATNYPLVLITNSASGHKFFARTHDFSTMAVATGSLGTFTLFDVTPNIELGKSSLVVIANGIPSTSVDIDVTE